MLLFNRLRDRLRTETARSSNVLWIGFESAVVGLILTLAILVFSSLLGLSDVILDLCFPLLFAALVLFGALSGFNAVRRGVDPFSQIALAGGISGLLMGFLLGILTGIVNVLNPFHTASRLVRAETQTAPSLGSYILPALAFCSLTFVLTFLGTIVGSLSAVLAKVVLRRIGVDLKVEPQGKGMQHVLAFSQVGPEAAFLPAFEDIPEPLRPAWRALETGERGKARSIIAKYLMSDMENETGWLLMAHVLDDAVKKQESLDRVLKLNPGNLSAYQMLRSIQAPSPIENDRDIPSQEQTRLQEKDVQPSALNETEWRKRGWMIAGLGAAAAALMPLTVMIFDRYALSMRIQSPIVIVTAMATAFILVLNLRKDELLNRDRAAIIGAIHGIMIAVVTVFTSALAYHTVFLPMNQNHTRFQGILSWIGDSITGSLFLGGLFGVGGALAAYYAHPLSGRIQARIRSAARNNAWAALCLAITSSKTERKAYFVDQALALGPSNPIARQMQRMLEKAQSRSHTTEPYSGRASIKDRIPLPPLATTEMGRKFLLRFGIAFGMLLACAVFGNVFSVGGELLQATTSLLVILFIILAGGFLLWLLVHTLRR